MYTGVSRAADDREFYRNGTSGGTASTSNAITLPSLDIFVLARNNTGSPDMYLNGECDFWALHNALSDNQAVDLYDAVLKYNQTVLVGALDADAKTYIDDAGITNRIEIAAINQLVLDLKGTGSTTNNNDLWTGMGAIYPVSPTSLTAAAFNLKDPTSFEITWYNSPTHATTGISGNGTTQYGDTGAVMGTILSDEDDSGMTYSGDYSSGDFAMGTSTSTGRWAIRTTASKRYGYSGLSSAPVSGGDAGAGIYTIVRRSTTDKELYKNGASIATNTTSDTGSFPSTQNLYVLGRNNNGSAGNLFAGEIDFWAVHQSLTDNEAQDLYDAITTYNTALSR